MCICTCTACITLVTTLSSCSGCVIQVVIIFNHNIMEQMAALLKFERFSSIWLNNKGTKCQAQNAKGEFQVVRVLHTYKFFRLFLAGTINIVGLAIVTTTIPVFLCTSETYISFVLNAAATLFIVELDDHKVDTKMVISGLSPPPTSPITVAEIADVVAATDACTDDADVEAADYHVSQSASQEDGGGGEEEDGAGGGEEEDDQV